MLSEEEVKKIALLGRIGLSDHEVARYQKDLSAVFDFFHELEQLPTDDVAPIRHITGRADVTRQDSVESFSDIGQGQIRKNMPDTKDNFLRVRSVF